MEFSPEHRDKRGSQPESKIASSSRGGGAVAAGPGSPRASAGLQPIGGMTKRDPAVLPISCRFVSTDQWLTTHADESWTIGELKHHLLRKCLPALTPHRTPQAVAQGRTQRPTLAVSVPSFRSSSNQTQVDAASASRSTPHTPLRPSPLPSPVPLMTSSPRSPPLPPTSGAGTSASRSLPADTASLTTRGDADSDQSSISSGDPVFAFDPHQEYDFEDDDALALDRWYSRGSRKGMYEAPDRYEKMKEERRAAAAAAKLARPPKSLAPASLATTPRATSFDGEPPLLGPVVPISAYHPQEMSVELTLSEIDDDEEVGITREIDLDSDPEVHGNGRDKDRNPLSLAEALMVTEPPNPPPPSRTLPLLRNSSRYFTPIEKEKEAPPPLSGIDAEVERAKGWVLYSFSNGNLLEEQMTVSGYRIRPGELIEIHRHGAPNKLARRGYHLPYFDSQVYVLKSSLTPSYQPASKLHKDSNSSLVGSTREKEKGREYINWQKQAELDALPTFTTFSTVTAGAPKKQRKKDKSSVTPAIDLSVSQTSSKTSYTTQFNLLGRRYSHDELRNHPDLSAFIPRIDLKGKGKEREVKKKDWKLRWMAVVDDRLVIWKEYYDDKSPTVFNLDNLVSVRELPSPHAGDSRIPFLPQVHIAMHFHILNRETGVTMEQTLAVRFADESTHSHLLRILHRIVKYNCGAGPSPSHLSTPRLLYPQWRRGVLQRAIDAGRGMAFLFKDYASGPWQPANQDGAVDLWDWDDASDVEWDDWRCDFDGGVDTIGLAGEGLQFQTTPTRKLEEPKKGRLRAQSAAQSPLDKLTSVEKIPSPNRLGPPTEEAESPRRARSSTIAAVRDGIPSFSITTSTSPAASPPRRTTSANVSSPSKAKRRPKDLKLFSDNLPKDATVEGGLKLQPRSPAPSYMTLPLLPPSPEL